jgi:hypothetical protein
MDVLPLEALGERIMICGPSNAGKSTLAVALARRLGCEAFHLDLFRHLPDTDWVQRSDVEFAALHDAAIVKDRWVMDGNYSRLMPQRFARATGIILLGDDRWSQLPALLEPNAVREAVAAGLAGRRQGQHQVGDGALDPDGAAEEPQARCGSAARRGPAAGRTQVDG